MSIESQRVTMYRALASASRISLLETLRCGRRMTITELAEAVDLHPNTTREHLARLVDAGFVTCEPEERQTRGRPRILYRLIDAEQPLPRPGHLALATDLAGRV